jgi:putative transposase
MNTAGMSLSRHFLPKTWTDLLQEVRSYLSDASKPRMAIQYIQLGKHSHNTYIECFNRTLRNELLDMHLFVRLEDVREDAYRWVLEYNE